MLPRWRSFFLGTGGMPFQVRYQGEALSKPLPTLKSGKASHDQKQARLAYSLIMKPGRVVTPENWLVLRWDRSGRLILSYDPEAPLDSFLRVS